jgi:hypothetical protein
MAMGLFQRSRSARLISYTLFTLTNSGLQKVVFFGLFFVLIIYTVAYRNNVKYNYCKQTNRVLLGQFGITTKGFVKILAGSKIEFFCRKGKSLRKF